MICIASGTIFLAGGMAIASNAAMQILEEQGIGIGE